MEENIQISFRLLLIGMTTVCTILLLVVLSSKLLINIVNKFSEEKIKKKSKKLNPSVVAAINATVEVVTEGKGKVKIIKKI